MNIYGDTGRGSVWLLNYFFLSFSNQKNRSIKNICVYSKSKIKTKVTSKQNLEHFKMINRRLFIPKFCNNSKCCCHPPGQYLVDSFLIFDSFLFSMQGYKQKNNYFIVKIEKFQLCFIICFDTTKYSHILFLLY